MKDVTDKAIDHWLLWLRKQPTANNKGRTSFRMELVLLRSILNWYRNEVDSSFHVPIVNRHRQAVYYKPVEKRRPDYFMRKEDIQVWIRWLREHKEDPVYWRLAMFMVLTGVRVGEAAGLFWDSVDFRNEIAVIVRSLW